MKKPKQIYFDLCDKYINTMDRSDIVVLTMEEYSKQKIENLHNITKKDLFEAFSYYAFTSVSNQPYNEKELIEEFENWFKIKFSK